jgi:hypothetical protein
VAEENVIFFFPLANLEKIIMALGAFRMMHAENKIREFAYTFFSELGCLSPERSMPLAQLRALGFGVTETQDGRLYFDIDVARHKVIRSIVITWALVPLTFIVVYIFAESFGMSFIAYFVLGLQILLTLPISAYVALPLRNMKKK